MATITRITGIKIKDWRTFLYFMSLLVSARENQKDRNIIQRIETKVKWRVTT
jgi:hypothetical protein